MSIPEFFALKYIFFLPLLLYSVLQKKKKKKCRKSVTSCFHLVGGSFKRLKCDKKTIPGTPTPFSFRQHL